MRYSSRFFLYAPFVGLLLLAAVAMTNWWFKASAMAAHLDAINGHEIMPGVRVSFSEKRLAGFPFRLDAILKNLQVEVAGAGGPAVWTSEGFALHTLAYGRVQAILEAGGRQMLSWRDGRGGLHRFTFLPGTFRASALLQNGKLIRFDSEIVDLDGADFRAGNAQLHARTVRDGVDVYFKLLNAHITGGYAGALGPDITALAASGHVNGGSALQSLLSGDEAPHAALDRWRSAGGSIDVSELSVVHQNRTSRFTGKLTLDAAHDLSGTLNGGNGTALQFSGNRLTLNSGLARP
ncbi:MAG: DUF2125 domain-containing protein [Alphaproteobacteria bacterium]|nr:DUF2125 domain-containing protein [Alphaproteobacteria bacterium]MBV9062584.1 DUF2125 domain-containing protein [Alphaproteobacteria bacterium]